MDEIFSPQRLQFARKRRGFFMQELAARVGTSTTSVSAWENGRKKPVDENVDALSKVLKFPREFFFGDAPPTLQNALFRSLSRMTARQRDMAVMAGSQAVALDQWISANFDRPAPNVFHDFGGMTAEDAANALRASWGLGYRPIPNLVHLLEKNGVRVYSLVHDGSEIDAFSDWQGSVPFVFLNTAKTAERSRMDAAHELGHLVLHAHAGGGAGKTQEDEARDFASSFLMPAPTFVASAPRRISLPAIIDAKQQWGVSALAYVYRLNRLGRLTKWQYQSLCIQIKSGFGNSEPGPERPRETSQVLGKVFAPNPGQTTARRDAAKHLRVYLSDIDDLTFGLALTPMIGGSRPTAAPTESGKTIRLMK